MKKKKEEKKFSLLHWINRHKKWFLLGAIFVLFVFLLFYQLEGRLPFSWDQVDNIWAAKRMIVEGDRPLLGMAAKGNSGFSIGPAYYYLIAPIYWAFDLSPIAAGYIAGLASIITFFVLFFIIKKLFSFNLALLAVFINTVSFSIINTDKIQWPVDFIVPVSLIIFYFLYKVLLGELKYILFLALAVGFAFQIHFTSVFYLVIIALSLPFFPRKKKTLYYSLLSLLIFVAFLSPVIYFSIATGDMQGSNMGKYLQLNYHGFHFVRVLQMMHDAFIEFLAILRFPIVDYFNFLLPPLFCILYYRAKKSRERLIFCYLMLLWFIVPWFAFSTYKGEISNYYFFMTRPMVLIILSYLTYRLFSLKHILPKLAVIAFWSYFAVTNVTDFLATNEIEDIATSRERVLETITRDANPHYNEDTLDAYLYYYYTEYKKGDIDPQ